jgi:hypothetical protein
MITINPRQLKQVKYLIGQSLQGNHLLFMPEEVRAALQDSPAMSESIAYQVEPYIEKLMDLETLDAKRAYLDHLDRETFKNVIRTYFVIIENNLIEAEGVKH